MPRVELIYDLNCPNVAQARRVLLKAFAAAGIRPQWIEWDRSSPSSPGYVRGFGSPAVLVDGRDAAGAKPQRGGLLPCLFRGRRRAWCSGSRAHCVGVTVGQRALAAPRVVAGGRVVDGDHGRGSACRRVPGVLANLRRHHEHDWAGLSPPRKLPATGRLRTLGTCAVRTRVSREAPARLWPAGPGSPVCCADFDIQVFVWVELGGVRGSHRPCGRDGLERVAKQSACMPKLYRGQNRR
jgi:hypothetical protein